MLEVVAGLREESKTCMLPPLRGASSPPCECKPGSPQHIILEAAARLRGRTGIAATCLEAEDGEDSASFEDGDSEAIHEILHVYARLAASRGPGEPRVVLSARRDCRKGLVTFAVAGPGSQPWEEDPDRAPSPPPPRKRSSGRELTPSETDMDLRDYALSLADVGLGAAVGYNERMSALTLTLPFVPCVTP